MNYSVSVILPVYNCEQYLKKAIESVIDQDLFNEIELIMVDDGSTDNSPVLCDSYAEKYDNIKVIHQTNSGVSIARNNGIRISSGEWITFLDSDDYLLPGALNVIKQHKDSDIICTQHKSNEPIPTDDFDYLSFGSFNTDSLNESLIKNLTKCRYFYTCWAKFFKRSVIINNSICFPEGRKIAEDMVFVYKYLIQCKKITISEQYTYYYNINADNTTKVVTESYDTFKFIYDWKTEFFISNNLYTETVKSDLTSTFVYNCFLAFKTSATYDNFFHSVVYLKKVFNDVSFYDMYIYENYSVFKTFSDRVLDWSIRNKKPVPFCILAKLLKIISKG